MSHLVLAVVAAMLTMGAAPTPQTAKATPQAAQTGRLLLQRVQQEKSMNLPSRGMTKAQVKRKYGAPLRKLDPRGGDTPLHPVIYRWEYAKYIVYFEHDHVIHTVLNTPAGNNKHPVATH